jgi:MFS family permease
VVRVDAILFAACLGMLAVGANGTAIMAALPTMRRDLGLTGSEVEWAINTYLVVSAACIIPGGKFSDQIGANRVAMAGLVVFAVGSAITAMAGMPEVLFVGRAWQGLGAALAVPGTLAAIGKDPPKPGPSGPGPSSQGPATQGSSIQGPLGRAARIGAWAGFLMLGFSIGPLMGGALTHYLGWRVIFWCNTLAMLLATGGFLLRREPCPTFHAADLTRFDWTGFVLVAIFMISLNAALQALPSIREAPIRFVLHGAIAFGALLLLLWTERSRGDPLIDLRAFTVPAFLRSIAIGSIAMFSILALLLYFNLDAQDPEGLGFSAIDAGLVLLPLGAGLLAFAFSAPALIRRFGAPVVLVSAMLVIAVASAGVAVSTAVRELIPLRISLFAIGSGLALPYATAPRLALATLPADQAGQSSGIINACTFLGGSLGVAGGAVAFHFGGLSAVMGMIATVALAGAWICGGLGTPSKV